MRISWMTLSVGLAILAPTVPANAQIGFTNNLETAAPLVVPTTPSQVKIERTKPITLQEALDLANRTNRDIIQARINVDRNRAVLQEAEAARMPTVSASAGYTYTDSAQSRLNNINTGFDSSTISNPASGTVTLNYNIFNSGQVEANVKAAENQLRVAELDLNRITQTVRIAIATAYYNLQNTDEQVRIQKKSVENSERSLKDTMALEKAGVGTRFDVLQSQVQLANSQQSLLSAQASQLIARRELVRQLEYPANLDLSAADKIEPSPDWKFSLEDTILMALKNRSELDTQKLQRLIARDRARISISRLGPQVNVFTNVDVANNFSQGGGVGLGYRVGASLSMNLFDGGVANAQVNQAKADQALAESRFQQSANQVRFEVEQPYLNLQSRRQQIITSTKAVEQSTEALRLARLRLSAGVGTQLEVLRAEDDFTRADGNRLQAIIGFNQSLADLQRAINGI